jgi:hypothetical protein
MEIESNSPFAGREGLLEEPKKSFNSFWPLVAAFTLLVFVTSEGNRTGKPKRRKSADEEQERTPQPTPLVILNSTVMDAQATDEHHHASRSLVERAAPNQSRRNRSWLADRQFVSVASHVARYAASFQRGEEHGGGNSPAARTVAKTVDID